ncbi:hypothetical protein EVJ24_14950 [Exiguobacterium sp. SH1S21]|uniref:winged helix-turn-helix domain-containing protein n=1 Tax=Exiguobacterium sp. SH1S21 TaxID=2510953 RepID=UPI00103ABF88|nr:winged helix-turn-helix domain-containing protein [Exiguobacterium sp. SH1S21]TCI50304.1 hypothetical protein EVJ24_14950 [Exiguobacterium sp. SH1S21]
MGKKEYKAGDTLVLRLRKSDILLMKWASIQGEIGDGMRYLIEEEIERNGMKDLSKEIEDNRPMFPNAKDIQRDLYLFILEKGEVKPAEAYEHLATLHELDDWKRTIITRTGDEPKWHNIVRWAKEALKHDGLVQSKEGERGVWVLTESAKRSYELLKEQ